MAIAKFAEPKPGVDLGTAQVAIDERALNDYYQGLELDRPMDAQSAPSMVAANVDMATRMYFENDFGNLWLRQEWDFRKPLAAGATYEASGRSIDVYQRRDRSVILTETVLKDEAGDVAVVQRHHQSFVLDQNEGKVTLRDPSKKEGARSYSLPEGDPFGPIVRTISLEMCGSFFHGDRNYHTDKQASEELGFTDVVVGGKMTMSLVGELLDQRFGDAWKSSGKLLVKFTNIVWPNETVTVKGVLQGSNEDDPERRNVACWVEKENGVIVVVAEGSLRL
ncbi:MAG: MaoC/PaaZ C-terminal domain-containing protein [Chloroflexi bacterium]|nr:MaoC/PaaZ C-terminal domain-containing protein [Chloroflexota bacterium]